MSTAADRFEHIIRQQTAQELVPFLLVLDKREVVPVREKLKELRRELDKRDETTDWQSAMTNEQEQMLQLAAIVTFTSAQVLQSSMRFWFHRNNGQRAEFWQVMDHARPAWLMDFLLPKARSTDTWNAPLYSFLRELEQRQLLVFEPELFAKSLPNWLSEIGTRLNRQDPIPGNAYALIPDMLAEDSAVLHRDLLLLFEFDTHVEKERARMQKRPASDENWAGRWQEWNSLHPSQQVDWQAVFVQLAATGHLNRADLLTRCLLALRRDYRRPLLTWFKSLFLTLQPIPAERLALQSELAELLTHAVPLVANFALAQLMELLTEPGFSPTLLLPYADGLFLRPELKTGIQALLAGLLKLVKQEPAHAPAVARLLAACLAHPDAAVQERAAKGLAGLLTATYPLLDPTETAAAIVGIQEADDLLNGPARTALAAWLAPPAPAGIPVAAVAYMPAVFEPELSAATAIVPVADWHELLFLTGQVVQHRDPVITERWLDGLLRLQAQLPADFVAQLKPYLVQLLPSLKKASATASAALLAGPVNTNGHEGLAQAVLLSWATGFATARVARVNLKGDYAAPGPLLPVEKQRYLWAETLLRQKQVLPLLSTPTHQPYWVAPNTLVARLLAYQVAGIPPAPADLVVALARTAHAHAASTAEALAQLPALAHLGLRELLAWFLGPAAAALPALPPAAPQRPPAKLTAKLADALPELWAVAARTKAPAATLLSLPAALGYDYPGVAQPLLSGFVAVPHENRYTSPGEPPRVFRYVELAWDSGTTQRAPSPLLLYAPPVGRSQRGSWKENWAIGEDLPFFVSLLPHHPVPVHEHALRNGAWTDKLETAERAIMLQALRSLLPAGPVYVGASLDLLASGLVHHLAECRRLAQEVLLRAIAAGRLLPAALGEVLGRQLAAEYVPMPRLADGLAALSSIDPLTDDALLQVLDALLPELPAAPPRNTRKLLETYAAFRLRAARPMPAAVRARLAEWQAISSLKPVATTTLSAE